MNNDLISRSALLEAIAEGFFKTDPTGEEQLGYLACSRIVREFPAVDAEVVRCKDCRFGAPTYLNPEAFKHCCLFCKTVNADFFCAGGERKMDGEHNDIQRV